MVAISGICTSRGAQRAIRNAPNARQVCNPPQSASAMHTIQNRFRRSDLELRGPKSGLESVPVALE
eukprot:6197123-Alexandrium_andersonii.AAC.1